MPLRKKGGGKSKPFKAPPKEVKKTPAKKRVEESEDEDYDSDEMNEDFVGFNSKNKDEDEDDEQEVFNLNLGKDDSDEVCLFCYLPLNRGGMKRKCLLCMMSMIAYFVNQFSLF